MRNKTLILVILFVLIFSGIAKAEEPVCDDWLMFNYNTARTCVSNNQAAPPFLVKPAYTATAAIHSSVAITSRFAVVGSDDQKIYCYDTFSFRIRWDFKTGGKVRCSPTIAGAVVVCGSYDGYVYCINLETGFEIWKFKTDDVVTSSPLVVNNKVYIASHDMKVYCIDLLTGNKVWAFHTGAAIWASPTYLKEKKSILIGSWAKKLYSLDADSGRLNWEFGTESEVGGSCSTANGNIFFGTDKGQFYCLDSSGSMVWKKELGAHIWATPALIDEGDFKFVIIPSGYDKMVRCLYQDNGEEVWTYRTENWNYSSPAIGGKYVFFGSDDQNLYCLNWKTGQEVWKGSLGYIIEASPVLFCEAVYVGTWGGTVQVYHPGPILKVDPIEIDFGTVEYGTTPFKDFTITNMRNDQFKTQLEGKIETDETHLSFSAKEFFGIENKSQRTIRVTLDPANMSVGNQQALVKINSNGGSFNLIIKWKIISPAPPCLKVNPTELNFGYVKRGEEISKTITLTFENEGPEEVQGMIMGEDRWIDVDPVTFTSIGKKAILKVTINASRLPAGNKAQGRLIIATRNDVCQQVQVDVEVETEPRIELTMNIGDTTAYVNKRPVEMDVAPYVTSKGRTMVPLRFISEVFGATVKWIQENKQINIDRFDKALKLWVGKPEMEVNGMMKAIPSPPEIKSGRTMVPFRAISEGFDAEVTWVAETKTVIMVFNP